MILRKAKIEDCKEIHQMCKVPGLLNPSGQAPKLWWIESFVKEKQIFIVAEEKKKILGFALGERTTGNISYFWMIAVKDEYQSRGIGKKLLKEFEKESKKRKLNVIVCYGFEKSKKALFLLKKSNFEKGKKYYEFVKFL